MEENSKLLSVYKQSSIGGLKLATSVSCTHCKPDARKASPSPILSSFELKSFTLVQQHRCRASILTQSAHPPHLLLPCVLSRSPASLLHHCAASPHRIPATISIPPPTLRYPTFPTAQSSRPSAEGRPCIIQDLFASSAFAHGSFVRLE